MYNYCKINNVEMKNFQQLDNTTERFIDNGFVWMPIEEIRDSTKQVLLPFCATGSGMGYMAEYHPEWCGCNLCSWLCDCMN